MDDFLNFLPIGLIVIMIGYIILKVSQKDQDAIDLQDMTVSDNVYLAWAKQSRFMKTLYTVIFVPILLFLILLVADDIGLIPVTEFLSSSFEEFAEENFVEMIIFVLVAFLLWCNLVVISTALSDIDISKWLKKNNIDCYAVLKNSKGSKAIKIRIGNGYIINENPNGKSIFYKIMIGNVIIVDFLIISLVLLPILIFMKSLDLLILIDAIFFCVAPITLLAFNVIMGNILKRKLQECLQKNKH